MYGVDLFKKAYVEKDPASAGKRYKTITPPGEYNYETNKTIFSVAVVNERHGTLQIQCDYENWTNVDVVRTDCIFYKRFMCSELEEI